MTIKERLVALGSSIAIILIMVGCVPSGKKSNQATTVDLVLDDSLLVLVPDEGVVYYRNEPFSGTAIQKNLDSEHLSTSREYVNGLTNGLYKKWYEDGTLSYEAHYQNGKQHGISHSWWRDGQKRSESHFVNGIPDGKQVQWYKNGQKFKELNLVDGREVGIQKAWRDNGKIYINYEAKNGRIFGLKRASLCYELEEGDIKTDK